ncbi:hypothetical protein ACXZ1K_07760 [Pedobacter sp. PWIIR3]
MKTKIFLFLTAATMILASCGSSSTPEKGSESRVIGDSTGQPSDTTITATGATSGDNGAGADTTDMNRQRATRSKGNNK